MEKAYILKYGRSGIGKLNGQFSNQTVLSLSEEILNEILKDFKKQDIEEVIVGCVMQHGLGQNIARQIAKNTISDEVVAYTVNNVCGSSMKALKLALSSIQLKEKDVILVGGVEKMTNSNYFQDGLTDAFSKDLMGIVVDKSNSYEKEILDQIAFESHKKAIYAKKNLLDIDRIKYDDEHIRYNVNLEKIKSLKPIFSENGVNTSANSSGINDGVAFMVVVSEKYLKENKLSANFELVDIVDIATSPSNMSMAPVISTKKLLKKHNLDISDISSIELNEAFASQVNDFLTNFNLSYSQINEFGGAIALGHPIGASGVRIITTLLAVMSRKDNGLGLASLCIGGGQGMSALIKKGRYEFI